MEAKRKVISVIVSWRKIDTVFWKEFEMKTQSLMGFKCRKPKIQSRPSFPSPYSWGHHFSSHRPWHCAGILRQPPEKVFLLLQAQTGQEKIIRVASWSYKERSFVEPARKRCPENAGNLSCPLKNLTHKHSRKRRLDENVWNCERALKFSIVPCKQLDGNGIMCVCVYKGWEAGEGPCTRRMWPTSAQQV